MTDLIKSALIGLLLVTAGNVFSSPLVSDWYGYGLSILAMGLLDYWYEEKKR